MSQPTAIHHLTIREAKKSLADIEYFVFTSNEPETLGILEIMLKKLGVEAQNKRQKLVAQQKELKKT